MRTFGPIDAYGPTSCPSPISAPGWTRARGSISAVASQLEQQVRFGHDLLVHVRGAVHARSAAAVASERDLEPQTIAGHDLPAELRVVDAAQVDARRPAGCWSSSRTVEACASASIISTPGMSGAPGKWPWKNSSLTVTFLAATRRRPGSCCSTTSSRYDG